MPLWRSQLKNVYFTCQRCGVRQPLSLMKWQNGILVCIPSGCVDKEIVGQQELKVAQQVGIDRHEMEPDRKLVSPIERKNDQLEVLY